MSKKNRINPNADPECPKCDGTGEERPGNWEAMDRGGRPHEMTVPLPVCSCVGEIEAKRGKNETS